MKYPFIKLTSFVDEQGLPLYLNVENIACYYVTLNGSTCIEMNTPGVPTNFKVRESVERVTELIEEVCDTQSQIMASGSQPITM